MKRTGICFFLLLIFFSASVFAGEPRQIELSDGSVITGEIIFFKNGEYTIKTNSLGTVKINESKIRVIRSNSKSKNTTGSSPSTNDEIKSLQKTMMNDQQIMNMIISLQNDPAFQEILKDPGIMDAVNSGDISTLMSNPKFMNLLKNITVQEIQKNINQ